MTGCHAKAGCGPATDRKLFGWLCDDCWAAVYRIVSRIVGRTFP